MKLTAVEQRETARKAQWYLDVSLGRFTNDSVVFTGDGVEDLDRVIQLIASGTQPGASFMIDVAGTGDATSGHYKPFDIDDLLAIRGFFTGFYGEVNKPQYWVTLPAR